MLKLFRNARSFASSVTTLHPNTTIKKKTGTEIAMSVTKRIGTSAALLPASRGGEGGLGGGDVGGGGGGGVGGGTG